MTPARIAELRALADAMGSRVPEDDDRCVKCNESMAIGDGMDPTTVCNGCAQEIAEALPELLDALAAAERERDDYESSLRVSQQTLALVRDARDELRQRAEAAEAALEVASEALVYYADAELVAGRVGLARAALAKLLRRRTP